MPCRMEREGGQDAEGELEEGKLEEGMGKTGGKLEEGMGKLKEVGEKEAEGELEEDMEKTVMDTRFGAHVFLYCAPFFFRKLELAAVCSCADALMPVAMLALPCRCSRP